MKAILSSPTLSALAVLVMAGCTGGGPTSPTPSQTTPTTPATPATPTAPVVQVLPATFDFGKVTANNNPAPLEVSIGNSGNAPLSVTSISFRTPSDASFQLKLDGGAAPCGSATPTIPSGMRCTVQVAFNPGSSGVFASTLQVNSNANNNSPVLVPISGLSEPVLTLVVRINQLQRACPSNALTAYVSVTDQGGYPVPGLNSTSFSVTQGTSSPVPLSVQSSYVDIAYQPIATAAALDYSNSLTSQPVAFADMKSGFVGYFGNMRTGDVGEVVKFGSEVEVTQAFTSDKAALLAAISAPFDKGGSTKLYDAATRAVDDAAAQTNARKAVILATDGVDNASTRSLADASAYAASKGVPIFALGIGGSISASTLQQLADTTGGLYYEANTSQNLATIYQQLSSILYRNQYILTFDQQPAAGAALTIGASSAGLSGSRSSSIPPCS